jgi:hypothetical protein
MGDKLTRRVPDTWRKIFEGRFLVLVKWRDFFAGGIARRAAGCRNDGTFLVGLTLLA